MLTLLFTRNLRQAGTAGGASVGAPVVSVGVPATTSPGGGGGARHFGAGYDYDDPVIIAAREEVKILRKEKRQVKRQDNSAAMLIAIEARLRELYALLESRREKYQRTVENYEHQARMAEEAKIQKRAKRKRRLNTIMRLLN